MKLAYIGINQLILLEETNVFTHGHFKATVHRLDAALIGLADNLPTTSGIRILANNIEREAGRASVDVEDLNVTTGLV